MRYFPLVWAAIMRKPARAILTLLSVTIAFTLFGLMFGMTATISRYPDSFLLFGRTCLNWISRSRLYCSHLTVVSRRRDGCNKIEQ